MHSLQELGSWGSNLLDKASTQIAPAAAAAAASAAGFASKGSELVRSGAKAVKSSLKESLGTSSLGASHTFENARGSITVVEESLIAEGGFGEVLRVTDQRTGRQFALKKIRCQEGVQVASSQEAAEREAKVLQQLPVHPNIIRCFGYKVKPTSDGCLVNLLLELCSGGHLLYFMDSKNGRLSPREVLGPFMQVVGAVQFLHGQQPPIQHRDLKVENVLQGSDGQWKLCDFGSCSTERIPAQELPRKQLHALQEDIEKTVTMMYRPPEMADVQMNYRHGFEINEQVDLWMLGCILYTLAFYRHPFQDNATVMAITNAKYFIPQEHPNSRSQKLCGLIHWLLAANPKDRPTSSRLTQLLQDIQTITYEDLHALMPLEVQDKIKRLQALFGKRQDKEPPPEWGLETLNSSASKRPGGSPNNGSQSAGSGFDLRFALSEEKPQNGARAQGGPAETRPPEDLLSFGSPRGAQQSRSSDRQQSSLPHGKSAPAFEDLLDIGFTDAAMPPKGHSSPSLVPPAGGPAYGNGHTAFTQSHRPGGAGFLEGFANFDAAPSQVPSLLSPPQCDAFHSFDAFAPASDGPAHGLAQGGVARGVQVGGGSSVNLLDL